MCDRKEREYDGALFTDRSFYRPAQVQPKNTQDSWGVSSWVYAKALGRVPRAVKRYRLAGYNLEPKDKFQLSFYLTHKKTLLQQLLAGYELPF